MRPKKKNRMKKTNICFIIILCVLSFEASHAMEKTVSKKTVPADIGITNQIPALKELCLSRLTNGDVDLSPAENISPDLIQEIKKAIVYKNLLFMLRFTVNRIIDIPKPVHALAFSKDEKLLITGNSEGKVWIHNLTTSQCIGFDDSKITTDLGTCTSVAMSPDNKFIVVGYINNAVLVDIEDLKKIQVTVIGLPAQSYANVAFTDDSKSLIIDCRSSAFFSLSMV